MANNQDFVRNLLGTLPPTALRKKFEDALDDDLVWVAIGSSPLSGEYKGKQVYLEKIIGQLHTACSPGRRRLSKTFSWTETSHVSSSTEKEE